MIVKQVNPIEPIVVYPIADVHYGSIDHQNKEWEAFINHVENTPNVYLLLAGDLINNNTRSSVGSPWDDTVRPREQKTRMVEYLLPIKDRILCCVSGNHERRSLKESSRERHYYP